TPKPPRRAGSHRTRRCGAVRLCDFQVSRRLLAAAPVGLDLVGDLQALAQPISHDPHYVAEYALKSVARGRVSLDDIIVLPRGRRELPRASERLPCLPKWQGALPYRRPYHARG